MAGDDKPHGPEDEANVTPLERHARWLLRWYPAAYRQERGEEIVGTLLEASADRTWPRLRDLRSLAVGGLTARAAQNRQRTVGANLRAPMMAGLAMYLSLWLGIYLAGVAQGLMPNSPHYPGSTSWSATVIALLTLATIALAWIAPRLIVMAAAVAASAVVASFGLANGNLLGTRVLQVLALAGIAALTPRAGHPSRRWLWLPGLILVSWAPLQLGAGYFWLFYPGGYFEPGLPLFAFGVAAVLWIGIDARLVIALLTYFAVVALQAPVTGISSGFAAVASLPFLGVVVALAAPAVWVLRRQSALPVC